MSNSRHNRDRKTGGATPKAPLHPRIKKIIRAELGLGITVLEHVEKTFKANPARQLAEFLKLFHIPAGTGRARVVSFGTNKAYSNRLNTFFRKLPEMNMPIQDLSGITSKQVRLVFLQLEREGWSASWLTNTNTAVRRFCIWMGKPDLCPPTRELMLDPANATRHYTALVAKTWEENGVNLKEKIRDVTASCNVTGLQLRLMDAFGLRVKEALMLKPSEFQLGSAVLTVSHGTKGGRERGVPVETQEQRDLLAEAQAVASSHPKGLLMYAPDKTLSQATRHFYYQMEKAGITKAQDGVTAHGLRHGDFCDVYSRITGTKAPVLGGDQVAADLDQHARMVVARRGGHGRVDVTSAYLGNRRTLSRSCANNLRTVLSVVQGDSQITALASQIEVDSFCLLGPAAQGHVLPSADVLCFGFAAKPLPGESLVDAAERVMPHAMKIAQRVGVLLGKGAAVAPMHTMQAGVAAFELSPFGLTPPVTTPLLS